MNKVYVYSRETEKIFLYPCQVCKLEQKFIICKQCINKYYKLFNTLFL